MKDFQFIFLRLSIYLILGILSAFYTTIQTSVLLISGLGILLLFLIAYFRAQKKIFPDSFFGISCFLLLFFLGFSTAYFNMPENQPKHFINQNIAERGNLILEARVSEELKPTAFSQRFILKTENLLDGENSLDISGKLLLNLKVDSSKISNLKPGMHILVPWIPEEIKPPLNPFQFSYKNYMGQLKVHRQINPNIPKIKILDNDDESLRSFSWSLREELISGLKEHDFGANELAVFQALILGQRREISNELYKDYAAAGAIHILAISGLHVGILLFILNFLFRGLNRIKYGKFIKAAILILLLWSFAVLTGLSASVVRAVTMFSFIAIGLQIKRKTSVLNSLFLSLFVLLLIDPYYLFQVGFQLSYLAVFSIILFQPMLYNLYKPKFKLVDYFWKLSAVSIAAQIGVIPLSLYYFHQFPGLFLLSNLIILPFLGIILALGILIIILAYINGLSPFVTEVFNFILRMLNDFIAWVAGIESFVIDNIQISDFQTISLYLLIISLFLLLKKIEFTRICFLLTCVLIFQVSTYYFRKNIPDSESVIFHRSWHSFITMKNDRMLTIFSEDSIENFNIGDYKRERKITKVRMEKIPEIMNLSNKLSLIIDTTGNYNIPDFQPEIIILRNSPKINLERLIVQLSPVQIVVDGSNYNSFVNRWKATAEHKKIPFHYTGEKGAYILNSNN
ncbi:ComEC/Rec2 family competence protein [Christiangramia sp.]|uniref:ComEC/Rec2 family competence protein n=1 Tax=Christiangramia sp. TaxID=1931228 RepID=UPI002620F5EE|nr:ComEC/Rec2 family competence protein [Christiangramia sp.]